MSSDWPIHKVSDLERSGKLLVQDGNHGEYRPRKNEFSEFGTAFIRAADLNRGSVQFDAAEKINEEAMGRIRKGIGSELDTLLSTKGTVGKIAFVPEGSPGFVCSPQVSFWRSLDHDYIDPIFLFYELQSKNFLDQISSRKGETDMADYLSLTSQRDLIIRIPRFSVQKGVVSILKSMDSKIQLNYQINQTLEQMTQAIFKSWFVDFDPVKAKMAALEAGGSQQDALLAAMWAISGKSDEQLDRLKAESPEQYAELRATAELFPSAMQESELGEIPEGWEVAPFSELAKLDTRSVKPSDDPERLWEHFSIPAFDGSKAPALERGEDIKSNKYRVDTSSVLVSKLNPHFPRIWWPEPIDHEAAICSTEFMQFVPKMPEFRPFVAGMIASQPFQQGVMMRVTGSTGSRQRAQPKQVAAMDVVLPKEPLMLEYSRRTASMYAAQAGNIKQSQTLAQLRDTLLPKLLSGELTIPDAEEREAELQDIAHV